MKAKFKTQAAGKSLPGNLLTRLILMAAFICPALIAMSTPLPITNTASVESKKTIRDYFKFPQILVTRDEVKNVSNNSVEVLFTTNEKGQVNFALAKTENESLKREVERQFYKLHLPRLKQDVVHSVVLNFRTQ